MHWQWFHLMIISMWQELNISFTRHWVNSIPELELLFLMELINLELELKFATNKFNPQINLPFNFLIQEYSFYDNPTWNINY